MNYFKRIFLSVFGLGLMVTNIFAQDPNFHIYLCFGQSNMEGNASVEPIDRANVPERFKVMATVDFSDPVRSKGEWYVATPPLVRQNTGLTPMDYFGRTMIANLPEDVTVGVVPVAIGGASIRHLSKDYDSSTLSNEAQWFQNFMHQYDDAPYARLIECAKKAQTKGVIKGILLHQGETDNGNPEWPNMVKKVYNDILTDLGLNAADVPLFAGEVVTSDQGGVCGGMNAIIRTLPDVIPTAHVVSAANLPQKGDGLHFTAHGYRVLGCRYATETLTTSYGIENPKVEYSEEIPFVPTPNPSEGDFVFDLGQFNPKIWENGTYDAENSVFTAGQYGFGGWQYDTPIDLSGYKYIVAELNEEEQNGVEFRVFDTASYWEIPYTRAFNGGKLIVAELDGMMKNLDSGIVPLDTKKIYRVGFWAYGGKPIHIKHVFATNNDPYADPNAGSEVVDGNRVWKDIDYVGDGIIGHKLDIYVPDDGKSAHKVIVLIYGSAWYSNNSKGDAFGCLGKVLTNAGFAVVSINHRASVEAKYPAQINDVKAPFGLCAAMPKSMVSIPHS